MKKLIALLLALVMVLGLVACGAKEEAPAETPAETPSETPAETPVETPAEEPAEQEDVSLSMWIYEDGDEVTALYEEFCEAVNEAYPNITIEMEVLPYDSGPEKFAVACATNTTPDLYFDGYSRIAPAVKAGLTVNVSPLLEQYAGNFVAPQKDGIMADGNYGYLATATGAAYCILVNMDLAERLGVADMLPEDMLTWSYDDLLEVCRAAKAADPSIIPIDLFAGSQSSDAYTYSWFIANGVDLTNADLTATAFNEGESKENALEVLNFYKTLLDEGLSVDGAATLADTDVQVLWEAGNILFFHGAFSNMTTYYNRMQEGLCVPFVYDAVGIPSADGAGKPTVCNWGSYGYCGFKNNGNEEEVLKVLEMWITDPYWQSSLSNLTGRLSVMSTTTAEYPEEWIQVTMDRGQAYGAEYAISTFGILESWWADFRGTFYPQLQDFYVGNIDAETLLNNWQAAGDAVISGAQVG